MNNLLQTVLPTQFLTYPMKFHEYPNLIHKNQLYSCRYAFLINSHTHQTCTLYVDAHVSNRSVVNMVALYCIVSGGLNIQLIALLVRLSEDKAINLKYSDKIRHFGSTVQTTV